MAVSNDGLNMNCKYVSKDDKWFEFFIRKERPMKFTECSSKCHKILELSDHRKSLDYEEWFKAFAKKHDIKDDFNYFVNYIMFRPMMLVECGVKRKEILETSDLSLFFKHQYIDNSQFQRLYNWKENYLLNLFHQGDK